MKGGSYGTGKTRPDSIWDVLILDECWWFVLYEWRVY